MILFLKLIEIFYSEMKLFSCEIKYFQIEMKFLTRSNFLKEMKIIKKNLILFLK